MSNYTPTFPTAATPIPQFQPMLNNWSALNTIFGTDHSSLTEVDSEKRGHHQFVRLYDVAADPTLAAPQSQVYSKTVPVGVDFFRALFFAQKPNTSPQVVRQLTDLPFASGSTIAGGTTLNYRVYDTPWGWRIHTGDTTAFSGTRNFVGIAPGFLANILFSGACPFGGTASIGCGATPSTGNLDVGTGSLVPVRILVITSAV